MLIVIINDEVHFSTACTWDKTKNWALLPLFNDAVANGILLPSDTAYFQIFTIPNMPSSVAFNCPRLLIDDNCTDDVFYFSKQIIEGRKRINRLSDFCRKYLKGFENAYISNIADMPGIRENGRVKGKYIFTVQDIISGKIPQNPALASDYPIDIHSDKINNDELKFSNNTWYLPIESLISDKYDNLFVVGRCLSAEFKAQAAVRTQSNCFSMGEAVAKYIYKNSDFILSKYCKDMLS